jgi:hypothetical protein
MALAEYASAYPRFAEAASSERLLFFFSEVENPFLPQLAKKSHSKTGRAGTSALRATVAGIAMQKRLYRNAKWRGTRSLRSR